MRRHRPDRDPRAPEMHAFIGPRGERPKVLAVAAERVPAAAPLAAFRPGRARLIALAGLIVTNACDVGFLLFDARNPTFEPWLAASFLAGGAGYAFALVLVWKSHSAGFLLAAALAPPCAFVVVLDNLNVSPSGPDALVFALNVVFFLAQPPLVVAALALRRRRLA